MKMFENIMVCQHSMYLLAMPIYFVISGILYEFVHDGHCSGEWNGPNTIQATALDCRNECAKRPDIGYFAYSVSATCACYFLTGGCPDDDQHGDHDAFRILNENDSPNDIGDSVIRI